MPTKTPELGLALPPANRTAPSGVRSSQQQHAIRYPASASERAIGYRPYAEPLYPARREKGDTPSAIRCLLYRKASVSEPDLIRRARDGDAAAWEALIAANQEAVFRLAYLMLGDPAEAEDAAQETFIRAAHALPRFDESRPLRPWLLKIVSNQARNRRRSAGRYVAALRRALLAEPEQVVHPAAEHASRAEAEDLWAAARRLDPVDQEIIYLRYFMELPVAETAGTLGVPEGTVKSRLNRALGRLRAVIVRDFPWLHEDAPA